MRPRNLSLSFAFLSFCCLCGCGGRAEPVTADSGTVDTLQEMFAKSGGSGGGGGPVLQDPTGFATLTGSVKIVGNAQTLPPLSLAGAKQEEIQFCSQEGAIPDERLMIGANNELGGVVVYLDTKIPNEYGTWVHGSYKAEEAVTLKGARGFDQKNCRFLTHVFALRTTQTLQLINSDGTGHNTAISGSNPMNPTLSPGATFDWQPKTEVARPFPVSCAIHPWMRAYIIVRDSPYFAVTDKDGKFEIKNLPAGVPLRFRVWQEMAPSLNATASADGTSVAIKRGRFKLQLEDGKDQVLNVEVAATTFNN